MFPLSPVFFSSLLFTLITCASLLCLLSPAQAERWVSLGEDGKLKYKVDDQWNRIPDFSRAGYGGGGVVLPVLPVVETLSPMEGRADDTKRIQQAIDKVSARSMGGGGFRGAILLKRGQYRVKDALKIEASGVVLRGEGQGKDGTVILATGKERRTLIRVSGKLRVKEVDGSRRRIDHDRLPWGVDTFALETTRGYSPGDTVMVYRPSTKKWITDIGMDSIKARENTKQWEPGDYDLHFERVVTAVKGNYISLDTPVVNAVSDKYGGGYVYKYEESGRVTQAGIENLRLVSEYEKGQETKDEDHAWTAVNIDHAANCWVRNVSVVHFCHGVWLGRSSKFVTVQDCAYLKPVSLIVGGRRYPYQMSGQLSLVQRCYSEHARHAQATSSKARGPNVFLDCLAENTHADTGPHHRWAVGTLWDNLKGGEFNAEDRGNWGSGHGWAGALQVFWNCETSSICVQKPPTSQNFAIGCTGKIDKGRLSDRPQGHYESHGEHVKPRSLYLTQLEERRGPHAVRMVTTKAQREGTIYEELKKKYR